GYHSRWARGIAHHLHYARAGRPDEGAESGGGGFGGRGKGDERRGRVADRADRIGMAGCEVDRVELAAGGGIGVVDPGGVGDDGESGQWREVDSQRAHGREDAVVRRILDDEDVLLGVDLEEAGG